MTDPNATPAPWWDFEFAHPTGTMILNSALTSLTAALGIYKLASLLYFNHKLVFLLGPILLFAPIFLAWLAFRIVGAILSARAQRGTAEPLQQQKARDNLRRYSRLAGVLTVVVWGVVVLILHF